MLGLLPFLKQVRFNLVKDFLTGLVREFKELRTVLRADDKSLLVAFKLAILDSGSSGVGNDFFIYSRWRA